VRRVNLEVCFVTLSKVVVMFDLVRFIALYAFGVLESAHKYCVLLFPAVLVLGDF